MRESGVLTHTETPQSNEAQSGLKMLNRILGLWSNGAMLQFERVTESFNLSSGTNSYTIGSGGDFNTVRPTKIVEAHIRQGTIDYPLELVTDSIFQSVQNKTTGSLPEMLNYTNEYPLATINLYPTPTSGYSLFITSEKPLIEFANTSATVDLPPGWEDALTYALALRLARIYGQPADPQLEVLAKQSKASISLTALRNNPLQAGRTSGGTNNIYTGYAT